MIFLDWIIALSLATVAFTLFFIIDKILYDDSVDQNYGHAFIYVGLFFAVEAFILFMAYDDSEPKAIDVYQHKTEYVPRYKSNGTCDSIVIFKKY